MKACLIYYVNILWMLEVFANRNYFKNNFSHHFALVTFFDKVNKQVVKKHQLIINQSLPVASHACIIKDLILDHFA